MSVKFNFKQQVVEHWDSLTRFGQITRDDLCGLHSEYDAKRKEIIAKAVKVFTSTLCSPALVMVIGGDKLRKDVDVLVNFGSNHNAEEPGIESAILDKVDIKPNGGVMCHSPWSFLTNHAFILGGIKSRKTFYLHLPTEHQGVIKDELLWNSEKDRLRVLALEIAMLYAAGYRQVATEEQMETCGATFVSLDKEKTDNMSLMEMIEISKTLFTLSTIREYLTPY